MTFRKESFRRTTRMDPGALSVEPAKVAEHGPRKAWFIHFWRYFMRTNRWKRALVAALLTAGGLSAQATLVSTTLNHVVIGGSTYNVTFTQDSDGSTSFNDVFGSGTPALTFTTAASAHEAALAVYAAADAANFDYTPAGDTNGFVLPYADSATVFSYYTVFSDTPFSNGVYGPFSNPRALNLYGSLATFTEVTATVPEPASLALTGLALAGVMATRRRQPVPARGRQAGTAGLADR